MSIGSAVFTLIIGPLELLFEVIYAIANRIINNPGLSIIFLSVTMNLLVLPLYRKADAMQAAEREKQAKLQPWVRHIRKTFKGDERFMMLQTYYRQNNYKPTQALNGSFSLLLEIPFFIAAYRFLSSLQLLEGEAFGPIRNLGAPDALIQIAGISINLLPVLMTLINIISAAIYMKGFPLKSKIQMYGMALIFLVFLYGSPAGLVFYWTLNNVFSLLKNIFYKLKNPSAVIRILASAAGILLAGLILIHPRNSTHRQLFVFGVCMVLQIPLLLHVFHGRYKREKECKAEKPNMQLFLASCLFLTILTGILIPSSVIRSSPMEFVELLAFKTPLWYVLSSLLLAAGLFLIWLGIFFRLADGKGKSMISSAVFFASVAAVINYMFFGTEYGTLSNMLVYADELRIMKADLRINLLVLSFAALSVGLVLWRKKTALLYIVSVAMCLSASVMSISNMFAIQKEVNASRGLIEAAVSENPEIELSKNGKNVIVLMMDRAYGGFLPYLLQEKPALQKQFAGFTYYPNTISYGNYTNVGAPALFGGYEYTPVELDKRSDELLADKHDEALKVMPVLFLNNGYRVTVCDPPYAGYQEIPDLRIYADYPEIHKSITEGIFATDGITTASRHDDLEYSERLRNRNFFCYSLFRTAPLPFQRILYNHGIYNALSRVQDKQLFSIQELLSISKANGINRSFMNSYSVLINLNQITKINNAAQNTFLMLSNNATHEPMLLQEPEYVPANTVDNTEYDADHSARYSISGESIVLSNQNQMEHYQINMAAMIQLGNWFDYLRENEVFDNSRIIIVADHGRDLELFDRKLGESRYDDLNFFYPLLMVKDFDSQEFSVDDRFMTNADTPVIAFSGLIDHPVNPFTGKAINDLQKSEPVQYVGATTDWHTSTNNGTKYREMTWFSTENSMLDTGRWKKLGSLPFEG
ncbi:MAG: membrane protein insertase YidC [Oscillospiraceae bacterium]|nr:membrane protein insertase YidC [Oscillospiraceae bacterium]